MSYARANEANYTRLVAQAKSFLAAGDAPHALMVSDRAIHLAPTRWQAYVVAGGALQSEHAYDKALNKYADALSRAPESKRAALRRLIAKCASEETRAASSPQAQPATANTGPSYSQTVQWIQNRIREVGLPGNAVGHTADTFVCTSRDNFGACNDGHHVENGLNTNSSESGLQFQFEIDGCSTIAIIEGNHSQLTMHDADESAPGNGTSTNGWVTRYKLPFSSIGDISAVQIMPPDLRDHSHPIGATDTLPPLSPTWAISIALKDDSATYTINMNDSEYGSSSHTGPIPTEAGATNPSVYIWFGMLGNEDLLPHFKNALEHLLQVCRDHPEQAPKPLF